MIRAALLAALSLTVASLALVGPAASQSAESYSAGRWVADLAEIKQILADRGPNLDWSVAERGLDLKQVADETEAQLRAAQSDNEARQIVRDFLARMGDGHISIQYPDEKLADDGTGWGTASICKGLGYEQETKPDGLPFHRVGGRKLETSDSQVFPISVVDLPGGRLGVLRIPSFYEWGYYDYCPKAVEEIGLPVDGECNEECGAQIGQRTAELLTEAVARQIENLKAEGVSAIAVDITQNGGGSLWLDPIARMLTPIKLKAPRLTVTRTPSWRASLQANLAAVDADLANPITAIGYRDILTQARQTLTAALAEADKSCDRSGIWQGKPVGCSLLVPDFLYATGVLDYAAPGEFRLLHSSSALFFSTQYAYREGLWSGPLYVFMDEGSASAAEHFATLLKDNGAAVLIGEPTFGAGCGWMSNGDAAVTLTQTRAELHVPDCVWTRHSGVNEVAGIEPDLLVNWRFYDNPFQKARRLMTVLQGVTFAKPPLAVTPPVLSGTGTRD